LFGAGAGASAGSGGGVEDGTIGGGGNAGVPGNYGGGGGGGAGGAAMADKTPTCQIGTRWAGSGSAGKQGMIAICYGVGCN
jgi:hypothetical protein